MDEPELEDRLRRLGTAPIAPDVAATHLQAMEAVRRPRWRFGWRSVAAAAFAGFLVGSTGLAAAGTLPAPAQDAAHEVLGAVGIEVPRSTEGCPAGSTYRNHGEYVAAVEAAGGDVEAAAHSECGKPVHGQRKGKGKAGAGATKVDPDGDPCTGPPPWAGATMTKAERDAAKATRTATCGAADDDDEREAGGPDGEGAEPTTTTVAAPTTTTTPEPTTTTTTTAVEETTTTT